MANNVAAFYDADAIPADSFARVLRVPARPLLPRRAGIAIARGLTAIRG
jgi:hypothetical protein